MADIKTKLKIQLYAGSELVAESEDKHLWQRILTAITNSSSDSMRVEGKEVRQDATSRFNTGLAAVAIPSTSSAEEALAIEIGVSLQNLQGACSASTEAPYIQLDHHYWESLRRNTPAKGPGAVAPAVLAATLLGLWFRQVKMGPIKKAQIISVMRTIGLEDTNAIRGLRNCEWLQVRSDGVNLNPGKISLAIRVACAYCTQQPVGK